MKKIGMTMLSLVLSCNLSLQCMAAEPGAADVPDYDAETMSRLEDNTIEYDELQMLVHEYNPSIRDAWTSFTDAKKDVQNMSDNYAVQERLLKNKMEDNTDPALLGLYGALEAVMSGAKKSTQTAADHMDKPYNTSSLRNAEKTVTEYAQMAMIGYQTLSANMQSVQKMVELYQAQYQLKQQMAQKGLATANDVTAANSDLLNAQATFDNLQATKDSTRRSLIVMLGWKAEDQPEISQIPPVTQQDIEALNLSTDTEKAIGNNATLIATRHTDSSGGSGTGSSAKKVRTVAEQESQVAIKMEQLYQDVQQKKLALDAADTGYQSAEIMKNTTEIQHRLGMLGEAEYLGSQLSYLQKEIAKQAADMDLRQALETYHWAVQGVLELDD
jgi:hypothetical protein